MHAPFSTPTPYSAKQVGWAAKKESHVGKVPPCLLLRPHIKDVIPTHHPDFHRWPTIVVRHVLGGCHQDVSSLVDDSERDRVVRK
eukprot:5028995-Prymnesium_polylepis.1